MSFSITAKGSKPEVIRQLNAEVHHGLSGDGQMIRGALLAFVADAPEVWGDDTPIIYGITAYGHHQEGSGVPSLSVSLEVMPAGLTG